MWSNSRTACYVREAVFCLAVGMVVVLVLNSLIRAFSAPAQELGQQTEQLTNSQTDRQDELVKPPPTPVSRSSSVMYFERNKYTHSMKGQMLTDGGPQ